MEKVDYKVIIVGAGICGLTIANELLVDGYNKKDILVLEASDRPGGLIKTTRKNGYLCEWGPEGLRGSSENSLRIFELANIDPIPVSEHAKLRFLVHKGKLRKVPTGPLSAIFTPLISLIGKLRILREPFVKPVEDDETISDFISRRLGKRVLPIIDAFVSGIYGGNPDLLSTKYAFPILKELEQLGGSIIKGGIKLSKEKKKKNKDKDKDNERNKIKPFLLTSEDGMYGIISSLADKVYVNYSTAVKEIIPLNEKHIKIETSDKSIICNTTIIATGVNGMANIKVKGESPLRKIPESRVVVVTLGFTNNSFKKEIKGYGFLSPSKENTFTLGILFGSRLFPHHAPSDKIMLRCFVGGIRHPERTELTDDEIVAGVMRDIEKLLGVTKQPEYISIQSHSPRGIPQIMFGHGEIIDWRTKVETKYPNIHFTGIGWTSIACDGIISEARNIIRQLNVSV